MRIRLLPEKRKAHILAVAIKLSEKRDGWRSLTRNRVAATAECSESLVSSYFGTMSDLRTEVMRHAIKHKNLTIVAQGLAAGDPLAKRAKPELKSAALITLAG